MNEGQTRECPQRFHAAGTRSVFADEKLENELRAELHRSWIACAGHRPKGRGNDAKVQGGEICVIEYVENFPSQLK